ncbi:MAG TPA: aminotransferase [Gammaproteobacteria bacterium]|nr:aminotransferase [Gammaproteobacteria bacterium]
MRITDLSISDLESRQAVLQGEYDEVKAAKLSLDLTRGKPATAQLDLSNELDGILEGFFLLQDGTDVRNYGGILGIPEARELGATILGIDSESVMVGGNSSLTMMYNYVSHMLTRWQEEDGTIKFICPVPGYDRHFTICEQLGIEMITVGFTDDGPDMDAIDSLMASDPMIKGIWCVPRYSNPTGHSYIDEVVKRFAKLGKSAGNHFRIIWDNAYAVHHLADTPDRLTNLLAACEKEDTSDSVVMFASTSKVTFAGSGISFVGTSAQNLSDFEAFLSTQLIGFDKVNQLRHVRFLKDADAIKAHMEKHKDIVQPKFAMVEQKLDSALAGKGVASWTKPKGGYFVSLDTTYGVADEVVELAADAGVKLTPAGATFPYGQDPDNSNIRIAPTYPPIAELDKAMDVFVLCLELATVTHLITA